MFISENRFILKTCGTTTLLYAIEPLITLVQDFFPRAIVTVNTCTCTCTVYFTRRHGMVAYCHIKSIYRKYSTPTIHFESLIFSRSLTKALKRR